VTATPPAVSSTSAGSTGPGWRRLVASAVSPGVWATALPFPSVLSYSYSYCLRYSGGVVVVDLGWDTAEGWQTFQLGLTRAGVMLDEIIGVVITHTHPDHYGFAAAIKKYTPAWIAAHGAERPLIAATAEERATRVDEMAEWLQRCGVPGSEIPGLTHEAAELQAAMPHVQPDFDLFDGVPVRGSDGSLVPVHTPGHTPGHLCFHDRERNLLFTGDHLLPRVTPNVSKRPRSTADPLADFMASLDRLARFERPPLVLPGHEWAFDGLASRTAAVRSHHARRLDEIEAAVVQGAGTVWDVARSVRWSRQFDTLDSRGRRQALGETYSHLYRLSRSGRLVMGDGVPERWKR
jgi:glyoxylase-like metal-dependent hydrolase (beta-lactamase superfamily II)